MNKHISILHTHAFEILTAPKELFYANFHLLIIVVQERLFLSLSKPMFASLLLMLLTLPPLLRSSPAMRLLVEVELIRLGRTLDLARVRILQIALDDVIPVLAHRPQPGILHDGGNDGAGKRVVPHDQAVEVDLGGQAHLARDGAEDEAALAAVAERWELDLAVQTAGSEKGRVEGIRAVGCHDDLDV